MNNTYEKIYDVVRKIPKGYVMTYGQVAMLAGNKNWARTVGNALHVNPYPDEIPCYRVVKHNGAVAESFAFGGGRKQRELLEADGIEFDRSGKVIMSKYCIRLK